MAIVTGAVAAVAGVGASIYGANKAASAQKDGIKAQREAAAEANALEKERFEWNKWVYENDVAPANKANQELQARLAADYLDTSKTNKEFATEQRDEYRKTYLPIERQVAQEAIEYDSDANVARRSGVAAANVNQQFSNSTAQRARTLGRYGLNPNSSAFAGQIGRDSLAQAAAASGAATGAAFDTKDRAIALRSGVANFGRNMPNTATQANATSNSSNAGASSTSQASANAAGAGVGVMNGAYSARVGGLYDYGKAMGSAGAREGAMWSGITKGLGALTGAAVNAGGGWGSIWNSIKPPSVGGMDTSNYMPPGSYIGGGI